jgi:hypothetical protein
VGRQVVQPAQAVDGLQAPAAVSVASPHMQL